MRTSQSHRRTTGWRIASTATVLAALGAALLGPVATAAEPDQREQVKSGTLTWGFKQSFRDYVEGPIADGGIEVSPPATRLPDGTFRWTNGSGKVNPARDTANLAFKGEVYFYGHDFGSGPQLEIWLDVPRVKINGDSGVVIADVTSRSMSNGEITFYDDVELADLDFTGKSLEPNASRVVKANNVPASLTADGAAAFAGFYAEGEELDPVDFRVKLQP